MSNYMPLTDLLGRPPIDDDGGYDFIHILQWLIAVMPDTHRDLGFCASLLGYAVKGGLTEKQDAALDRIVKREFDRWCRDFDRMLSDREPKSTHFTPDRKPLSFNGTFSIKTVGNA